MSDVNMEIKFEKTKFIQVHKEIIISKEDSYADLTYELGGTYNFVPGGRKPISKKILLLEYDKIVNSLLSLNYSEILKENEFLASMDGYTLSVNLSMGGTKIVFEVIDQPSEKAKPETRKLLEVSEKVFDLFESEDN